MSQIDKLIERIQGRPPQARFSDVQAVLEAFGWKIARQRGSHVSFVKGGDRPIIVPKDGGRWVKRVYLDQICERLGLDD